jgi:hypothetical protein
MTMNEQDHETGQPTHYQIRLIGHLDTRWSDWFDGLAISHEADGTTLLSGPVADQAALHGLLTKIGNLGLPLLAVIGGHETDRRPAGRKEQ